MTNSFGVDIGQKFRKYGKNKWILRRADLSKEPFYKLYMTPRDNLSVNPEPLLKRKFCCLRKIVKFAATRVLPVELSSGNKLQFWKEKYLRHITQKKIRFLRLMLASNESVEVVLARMGLY